MLLVLIALLFLPVVSAFAYNTTYPVTVLDHQDNPVPYAEVIVYDMNTWYLKQTGFTDNQGKVNVIMSSPTSTSTSLTNPAHNIGIVVIPNREINPNGLAFGRTTLRHYNMWEGDSLAGQATVTLQLGCNLTISPKLSADGVVAPGIANNLQIILPSVPDWVKTFDLSPSDINTQTPTWAIYWPKNSPVSVWSYSDSAALDYNRAGYYEGRNFSIQLAEETEKTFEMIHVRQEKGEVRFVANSDTLPFLVQWSNSVELAYIQGSTYFTGSGSIFLPKGTYSFACKPQTAVASYPTSPTASEPVVPPPPSPSLTADPLPPVVLFASVVLGEEAVSLPFGASTGFAVTGNVSLANNTSLNPLSNVTVVAQQKFVNTWIEVDNTWVDYSTGKYAFNHLFDNSKEYRIVTRTYGSAPGVVDTGATPYKCYTHHLGEPMFVDAAKVYDIVMPQAAGIEFTFNYPAGQGSINDYMFGYLPTLEESWTNRINEYIYANYTNNSYFLAFVNVNRPVVARADYLYGDYYLGEVVSKFSQPVVAQPGTTVQASISFDPTKFVRVTSSLRVANQDGSERGPYLAGNVKTWASPVLRYQDKNYGIKELFGLDSTYGVTEKTFTPADQSPLEFTVEQGSMISLGAIEDTDQTDGVRPLLGFVPYNEVFTVPVDQPTPMVKNILLNEGSSFFGQVMVNNEKIASTTVFVKVTPSQQNDFSMGNYYDFAREGVVTTDLEGRFAMAGFIPGRYTVELFLDFMGSTAEPYGMQTMPVIMREIYVDGTASTNPVSGDPTMLAFNLNPTMVGWLKGLVVDELNSPVADARVLICRQSPNQYPGVYYYEWGKPVFYCVTDTQGNIVTPDPNNQSMVPLEAGTYDVFVTGMNASSTARFAFSEQGSKPFATVKISTNSQITPVKITLKRKYNYAGVLSEDGQPVSYADGQIYDLNGRWVSSFMMNGEGAFSVPGGLLPGQYYVGISIFNNADRNFYFKELTVAGDVTDAKIALLTQELNVINLLAQDSNGNALPDAGGSIYFFTSRELGFDAPYWNLTWANSDPTGKISVSLPNPVGEGTGYGFIGYPRMVETFETASDGSLKSTWRTYSPPALTWLDVPSTELKTVVWQAPTRVSIVASVPADKAGRYIGVLMTESTFLAGKQTPKDGEEPYPHHPPMTGDQSSGFVFAPWENGKFVFDNVIPGKRYVFAAYESFTELYPEMIRWTSQLPAPSVFRHFSDAFDVGVVDLERAETFAALAPFTVTCTQRSELPANSQAVKMFFTTNRASSIGAPAWPIIDAAFWDAMNIGPNVFPIHLPVNYAFRLVVNPNIEGIQNKVVENLTIPAGGRTFDIILNELPRVSGRMLKDGNPANGFLLFIPEGVDPMSEGFSPIRVNVVNGSYTAFLKPGFFDMYAVPQNGAAMLASFTMPATNTLAPEISVKTGVPFNGRVSVVTTDGELPLVGASVMVMRKLQADSSMTDGQKLIPYPALNGSFILPCGPMGEFAFQAEAGVNYYVQPIVPAGFSPGKLQMVSVGTTPVALNIKIGEGGRIIGHVNEPAYIEAVPVGAIGSQFSSQTSFFAEAMFPETVGTEQRYRFTLMGLDPNMLYNITIRPMTGYSSVEKRTNVPVPSDPQAAVMVVNLVEGGKIIGRLVDADGNFLFAENVSVNLAMTLPGQPTSLTPTVMANYRPMKNITALDPSMTDLQNSMLAGMATATNRYGQFEFKNVPSFLTAFLRTEHGFSVNDIDYARARTMNFFPATTGTSLTVNIVVPVGGKIIGRVIDRAGKPVNYGSVETHVGGDWFESYFDTDGNFALTGLVPGANYIVNISDTPGFAPMFRSGVLVEPGKTTDLGAIVLEKAVMAYGLATGALKLKKQAFQFGIPDDMDLGILAVDGSREITDDDLLSRRYHNSITGFGDIYIDPFMEYDEYGFSMFVKPGKTNLGAIMSKDTNDGVTTMVSWGWRTGLNIPTEEQLEYGAYDLSSGTLPIMFPQLFGTINGSLKHAVDASATFDPADAVIALYPVDMVNNIPTLRPVPFPTAITNPIRGNWLIKDIPQGLYRLKVITRKFGTLFMTKVINIGNDPVREDISLGTSVVKVSGRVLDASDKAIASAKVSLVVKNLVTTTDTTGNFAFYLPTSDFLIPQVEISKPGIQTTRFFATSGIASAGAKIATDTFLADYKVTGSVGTVEVLVKSAKDNKAYIGAEIAVVYKDAATNVWTVAEAQISDENGKARFVSVPTGREVTFRARAHYHVPTLATKTLELGGSAILEITMPESSPKVFYTGTAEPTSETGKYDVKALFDFDRVVLSSKTGLKINEVARTTTFPDEIAGRITSMYYRGVETVAEGGSLIATVSYDAKDLAAFRLLSNAVFRKEYPVDPLAAEGFTGRQTDATGALLPTGISVPPGYLPPEIDSFNLEVASPTLDMKEASIETETGATVKPEFAGPAFSFTFGQGQSNFGAGTTASSTGLFEITIAYTEGTNLEPRWYDSVNGRWSKVGIIRDSIRYDYPTKGYVTFKVDHLTDFAILKNVTGAASSLRCDFNNDQKVDLDDVVYMLAWTQLSVDKRTAANVKSRAVTILSGVTGEVVYLPSAVDDVNNDGSVNLDDVVMTLAWTQLSLDKKTENNVFSRSQTILSSVAGSVVNLPGATVSR